MPRKKRTNEEIFWSHVKTAGPDECWLWQAGLRGQYGSGYLNGHRESAHRVSWVIHNGTIPQGLDVLHTCDTPLCVNPAHLWVGTHKQNMEDMARKGRVVRSFLPGELSGRSKLTNEQVIEIRKLLAEGLTQRDIGRAFGVSSTTISYIKTGACWGHLR